MLENMQIIVSSLKALILRMLKCLRKRDVTAFLPPPGGPIAAINWMSTREILDVSLRSYLKILIKKSWQNVKYKI